MANNKPNTKDALTLLREDHEKVKRAFKEFQKLGDRAYNSKKKLADEICSDLSVHAQIEEEIFYPAFRQAVKDAKPLVDEAVVEHSTAKNLIHQLRKMESQDELFDAKVTVLCEYINHHVKEEEEEIFSLLHKAHVDLKALGEQMAARKQELS